jgi:hypothetical protein
MSNEVNIKRGKGRPAGSNSFVKVRLKDLVALMGDQMVVPVSKIWLRENSIDIAMPVATLAAAQEEAPAPIEFSFTSFED